MGDLLGSLVWGAKSGQYCVIVGGSLHSICTQFQPKVQHPHKVVDPSPNAEKEGKRACVITAMRSFSWAIDATGQSFSCWKV
jgi:hypothetical protein